MMKMILLIYFMDFHSHYLSVTADASIWLGKIHLPQATQKRTYSISKFCFDTIRITKVWTRIYRPSYNR